MNLNVVRQFMEQSQTCVLSTVNGGKPQSAIVGFSIDDNFDILIATKSTTRKASNIAINPNVSIVVGFEGNKTVQLEGMAKSVNAEDLSDRLDYHFERVPGARKFADERGQTYFIIKPNWLRYTDYAAENPIVETDNF